MLMTLISANGTFLNSIKLNKNIPQELHDGDFLQFGLYFHFHPKLSYFFIHPYRYLYVIFPY